MAARTVYAFGPFRVDLENRILWNDAQRVPLTAKAFQTLVVLIQNRDRIIDKTELTKAVWPDSYTEESNLAHQVLAIRKALGEFRNGKQYIETIARRGYRFVGHIKSAEEEENLEEQSLTSALSAGVGFHSHPHRPSNVAAAPSFTLPKRIIALSAVFVLIVAGIAFRVLPHPIRSQNTGAHLPKDAERNYQEGRFFWEKRTATGYRAAIAHFQEAIKLDPNYAEAYAGLADSYILLGSFGIEPPNEAIPKARAAALRAIEIDDRSAEAHASMGYIMSRFDWNWEEGEREFKRAIELDSDYATAHQWYALHLVTIGRRAEAISEIRHARSLEPTSLVLTADNALVLFYARRYDEAIQECRNAISVDPSFGLAHRTLGAVYVAKGMYGGAIAEFEYATKLLGKDPWMVAEIGRSYAMMGDHKKALAQLKELRELSTRQYVSPSALALLTAALQETREESFQWLEKEYQEHSNLATLTVHPGFDPIRQDPRFEELLKRIGLPPS